MLPLTPVPSGRPGPALHGDDQPDVAASTTKLIAKVSRGRRLDLLVAMGSRSRSRGVASDRLLNSIGVSFTILCIVLDEMLAELGRVTPGFGARFAGQDALLSGPGPRRLEPPPRRLPFGLVVDPPDESQQLVARGFPTRARRDRPEPGSSPRFGAGAVRPPAIPSRVRRTSKVMVDQARDLYLPNGDRAVRRGSSLLVRRPPAHLRAPLAWTAARPIHPRLPAPGADAASRSALTRLLSVHVATGNERTDETNARQWASMLQALLWIGFRRRSLGARWVRFERFSEEQDGAGSSVTPLAVRPLVVPRLRRPHPPPTVARSPRRSPTRVTSVCRRPGRRRAWCGRRGRRAVV